MVVTRIKYKNAWGHSSFVGTFQITNVLTKANQYFFVNTYIFSAINELFQALIEFALLGLKVHEGHL